MRELFLLLSILLFSGAICAQYDDVIELRNPSFEGIPHKGVPTADNIGIKGWYDCGELQFRNESPADLHPIRAWEVELGPSEGNTYLGLVVRDNDSWESVSQRLPAPLELGKCYSFSIDMSRSPYYVSHSRITKRVENYTEPAVLRIWGGNGVCGHQELLAESDVVNNNEWKSFEFEIQPARDLNYVTLEAFYEVPILFPYNGHILVDNASAFKQIPCPGDEPLVIEDKPKPQRNNPTTPAKEEPVEIISQSNPVIIADVDNGSTTQKKKLLEDLDGAKVKKGQIIRIENLYFQADSYVIEESSDEVLSEVYDFLKDNRNILVEIGGHTNTVPSVKMCDELSTNRAKEVASYLSRKGISPKRMKIRGYGKRKPIIANDKYDMEARKKNQRVEIKILSLNYSEATG
jgi:outer membrane protein OmpA-like peptidoglycan-associated protein